MSHLIIDLSERIIKNHHPTWRSCDSWQVERSALTLRSMLFIQAQRRKIIGKTSPMLSPTLTGPKITRQTVVLFDEPLLFFLSKGLLHIVTMINSFWAVPIPKHTLCFFSKSVSSFASFRMIHQPKSVGLGPATLPAKPRSVIVPNGRDTWTASNLRNIAKQTIYKRFLCKWPIMCLKKWVCICTCYIYRSVFPLLAS